MRLILRFYIANFCKYIPGKVATIGILLSGQKQDVSRGTLLRCIVTMNFMSLAVSVCGAVGVLIPLSRQLPAASWIFCLVLLAVGLLVIYPKTNHLMTTWCFRALGTKQESVQPISLVATLRSGLVLAFCWLLIGVSFAIIVNNFVPLTITQLIVCTLVYPAAFALGIIAFFSPAGLGIREGILVTFLISYLLSSVDREQALTIAMYIVIWHRVLMSTIDLALLLLGMAGQAALARGLAATV